jgi:DNA polymerase-3 subunit chi
MSLVRFYACAGDPLRVALKLALKAREQGEALQVCAAPEQLVRLSEWLWAQPGFVAHAGPSAPPEVVVRSALRLQPEPRDDARLVVNLRDDLDLSAHPAQRVFELVGPDEAQRAAGRQRFRRHQEARGMRPEHVQVAA